MKSEKELLFRLIKKDFEIETFRSGGKGGQNQNKRDTGVRIRHPASGAVGESREHRTQLENKKAAFKRMVESEKFKKWNQIEVAKKLGIIARLEEEVEKWTSPDNLLIEYGEDALKEKR